MNFFGARFIMSCGLSGQLPISEKGELAFCGRSNVGKSSLINKLCNQKSLARVSGTPGKTVTINFFSLGDDLRLVDLPGYGYAKRSDGEKSRWARLMEHYFKSGRDIRLVLALLDIRHEPSADDRTMLEFLRDTGMAFISVLTKVDKLSRTAQAGRLAHFKGLLADYGALDAALFSVKGAEYAEALRTLIAEYAVSGVRPD
jgi:GTP-binding protein